MDRPTSNTNLHRKHAILALLILSSLNLINQIDRRALVTIFPLLKLEWGLSDAQLGLAVSLFTVGRTLITLPAGWLADRKGVLKILQPMVFLWSLFTIASAWAGNFLTFLALRLGVGLMDGANGPLDLAYLGKVSPHKKRGIFLAIYSIALYIGSGLGIIYAGAVGERFGWRWVFIIPGILGLIATGALFLLPGKSRHEKKEPKESSEKNHLSELTFLMRKPLPGVFIGGSLGVFASTALVSWLPTYLTRQYDLTLTRAGLITGSMIILASIFGTLLGGFLSDHFSVTIKNFRYRIAFVGLLAAMVFGFIGLLSTEIEISIGFFFLASISFTLPVSPLLVLVQEAVSKDRLATTQAAFGLTTQILGAAPATGLVGILSDQIGLQQALLFPFLAVGIGGIIILLTSAGASHPEIKM